MGPLSCSNFCFIRSFIMSIETAYRPRNATASRVQQASSFQASPQPSTYILLDDVGVPQSSYYLELLQWPSPENEIGKAVYVDDGSHDELRFSLDPARRVFRTHHLFAPNHHFDVKPIIVGDEVTELRMDLGNNDTATFVLHPEDYEAQPELGDGIGDDLIPFVVLVTAAF